MVKLEIKYTSRISEIKTRVHDAAINAAAEGMYNVLTDSQTLVPLDKGPLQESGQVTITKNAVYVSYGRGRSRKYAVDQHENMMYRHLPGRQAKYLEQPFRARSQEIMSAVARDVKDALQ